MSRYDDEEQIDFAEHLRNDADFEVYQTFKLIVLLIICATLGFCAFAS